MPPGVSAAGSQQCGQYKLPHYAECWSKLRMWEMTQYDRWGWGWGWGEMHGARWRQGQPPAAAPQRITGPHRPAPFPLVLRAQPKVLTSCRLVYLDADMAVLRNIDCLFALPPGGFYAAGEPALQC